VNRELSALEQQAADALRRARGLPVGADRNDLRQLATGLLWLHRNGMDALTRLRLENRFDCGLIDPRRRRDVADRTQSSQHIRIEDSL